MKELSVHTTDIPGLLIVDLPVHKDGRGWFKEAWQRAKMVEIGLPDFGPVQHNISFNHEVGVTRGIHAEPWDKFVNVATGRVFGAWVDLRDRPSFGSTVTLEMGPDTAVFVPRGVGNAYQTLEPQTTYSYLANDHWSAASRDAYTFLNLADSTVNIPWPIPLEDAIRSQADRTHPVLSQVRPMTASRVVIVGANGQLGRALQAILPSASALTRQDLDITDTEAVESYDWTGVDTVINAAAYTQADMAETEEGILDAWSGNVTGVANLVRVAARRGIRVVHVSSDYVYDGRVEVHSEDEPVSPRNVYGNTKAAGDALVSTLPDYYVIRTSWVVGDGHNFVRTMRSLAAKGISPSVVDDQHGRITFTPDLAAAIKHLLDVGAPSGIYNMSNSGPVQTWADLAADIFEACGRSRDDVKRVTTTEYSAGKVFAPRPEHSTFALDRLVSTGFTPPPAQQRLREWLKENP